jgi:aromatic ring-cleaving dioxygenase
MPVSESSVLRLKLTERQQILKLNTQEKKIGPYQTIFPGCPDNVGI